MEAWPAEFWISMLNEHYHFIGLTQINKKSYNIAAKKEKPVYLDNPVKVT